MAGNGGSGIVIVRYRTDAVCATTATVPTIFRTAATDQYTRLLLHSDGSGSTFQDSESRPKTITANGDATQSSSQSKFGGKSAYFDGTGDYLSVASSSDWSFGTSDFTIDFWTYINALTSYMPFVSTYQGGGAEPQFIIRRTTSNVWSFYNTATGDHAGGTMATGQWYHVAAVRYNGTATLYINGTSVVSFADSNNYGLNALKIGGSHEPASYFLNGYLDELRISKGIARWTSNFTPPTSAYTSTGSDVILK
jgi:hypothetical protein